LIDCNVVDADAFDFSCIIVFVAIVSGDDSNFDVVSSSALSSDMLQSFDEFRRNDVPLELILDGILIKYMFLLGWVRGCIQDDEDALNGTTIE